MRTKYVFAIIIGFLHITGCGQGPTEVTDDPLLTIDARLTKNYLGAPAGETLPVTFGPQQFSDDASRQAYIEQGRIFLASKTAAEIEMRLAVRRSATLADAEQELKYMITNPEGQAGNLPSFVLEQIAAFEMVQALLDVSDADEETMSSLVHWVDVMRENRNGSVIQLAEALEKLEGTWTPEEITGAAYAFLSAHSAYGECLECPAKNNGGTMSEMSPESPLLPALERHQYEIDDAVSRLRKF